IDNGAALRLHTKGKRQSRMVQVHVRDLYGANLHVAGEFLEMQARHQVVERDGKVVPIHLTGEKFFEAAIGAVQTVNVHSVARTICGLKKGKALNMVPVGVANK